MRVDYSMRRRLDRLLLIATILWVSWLKMMLVHKSGHVLGGTCSGRTIRKVIWHPAFILRTDVEPPWASSSAMLAENKRDLTADDADIADGIHFSISRRAICIFLSAPSA